MDAADHLVAVSNYDLDPRIKRLPRVGDYESIDWEKISALHPEVMVTDYATGRTPAGMLERMKQLGIRGLNLKFDRLDDIYDAALALGDASGERAKATEMIEIRRSAIQSLHDRVAIAGRIPALIVTGAEGTDFAGGGNFLNDLLNEAGGVNVIASQGYPTLDREAIAALKPQVIFQLAPNADAAARERAAKFWSSFPKMDAVTQGRVYLFSEPYVMVPGSHVAELARRFGGALHPDEETLSDTSIVNVKP